jgi:hypothetical protein
MISSIKWSYPLKKVDSTGRRRKLRQTSNIKMLERVKGIEPSS